MATPIVGDGAVAVFGQEQRGGLPGVAFRGQPWLRMTGVPSVPQSR
jgi:hypothetical protein